MNVQTQKATQEIIAVKNSEAALYGCPHCGYRSGSTFISGHGSSIWRCGECDKTSVLLDEGIQKSTIGMGDFYPEVMFPTY